MARYRLTCQFFDTEDQAKSFCDRENQNRYLKKNHPAHYTTWTSQDRTEHKFIAWYYTK